MKSSVLKIITLLLFSTLLLGCNKDCDCPAPEGTLYMRLAIPATYLEKARIEISPVENLDIELYKFGANNQGYIEIDLNVGNYKVNVSSYPYSETQYVQIRQGQTTKVIFSKEY